MVPPWSRVGLRLGYRASVARKPSRRRSSPREDVQAHVVDLERIGQALERRAHEGVVQLVRQAGEERAQADRAEVAGRITRVDVDAREPAPDVVEAGGEQAALGVLRRGELPVAAPAVEVRREARLGRRGEAGLLDL